MIRLGLKEVVETRLMSFDAGKLLQHGSPSRVDHDDAFPSVCGEG